MIFVKRLAQALHRMRTRVPAMYAHRGNVQLHVLVLVVWPAALAAFAAATLTLAWLLGRIVSDRYAWSQWLLWIPTPIVLAGLLIGLLVALRPSPHRNTRRRRLVRWSIAFVIALIYFSCFEHRMLRWPAAATADSLRLVHWNITDDKRPYDIQKRSTALIALDGDITIVTGVTPALWNEQAREALGGEAGPLRFGSLGLITRLPVLAFRPVAAVDHIYIAVAELDATAVLGKTLVLYLVDLPSEPKIPRFELAQRVHNMLENATLPPPDLVVGDLNITRNSASLRAMFPAMRHAFDEAGYGYGASYHRDFPLYHIDHVLLGPHVRAQRYELMDTGCGRHRAQVAHIITDTQSR